MQQIGANDLRVAVNLCFSQIIVDSNLNGPFGCISRSLFFADGATIHDDVIKVDLGRVLLHDFQMLPGAVTVSFTRLRHKIADENLYRSRLPNRLRHPGHEQVRKNARV